jgi:hypothetical protein
MINILFYMQYPELTYSFLHILSAYVVSLSYKILNTKLTSFVFGNTKWLLWLLEQFLYLCIIHIQLHPKSCEKVKFESAWIEE